MERRIRLERELPKGCKFDDDRAIRALEFFEANLVHTKGRKYAGRPFLLRDWQARDLAEIFGRVDADGNRLIRQVYYEIPKKNGKSEVAAGVANLLLFADDEPGAEIYGAASDREQAGIVYNVAASMVRKNPLLKSLAKISDSRKTIALPGWESFYRAVSADVAGKHGYNSHGVIFDEVHAQKTMQLWEVLTFGAGDTREQPLTFAITTAGVKGESPVAEMLHEDADQILRGVVPCPPDFYPVIYAAPDDADWTDEEVWHYCNPALGDFLRLDSVRKAFDAARRRPLEENSFRRLRLNQWVSQEVRWIRLVDWDKGKKPFDWKELRDRPCYVGIDLSSKLDLTAVVVVWLDDNANFYILPFFFIPKDNLEERPNLEAQKYKTWIDQGLLEATPGAEVDFATIRRRVRELRDEWGLNIAQVALDPMFAGQLRQQLELDFETVEFRQTYRNFTGPCQTLEAAVADGRCRHGGHPVLRWNADCVTVRQKPDGAVMPAKPDRLKTKKRIDGIVAALMGVGCAMLNPPVDVDEVIDNILVI